MHNPTDLSQLLTVQQAAKECGLSRQMLYYHLHTEVPPPFQRWNGHYLFHAPDLRAWNDKRKLTRKRKPHAD